MVEDFEEAAERVLSIVRWKELLFLELDSETSASASASASVDSSKLLTKAAFTT